MGLAAPKKRTLVSADPRNNNWANNTETFGQKLLRAHGWTPGGVLGAKDSAHAEYLTEASSTHIKVSFREDNMGIGSKKNNGDTCTGLNDFQDLLGRLNGKTEVKIEAERQVRESIKRNAYIERKFGVMRFVQGGWLVGDQETKALEALEAMAAVVKDKEEDVSSDSDSSDSESEDEESEQAAEPTKKRKADDAEDTQDSDKKKSKKRKSSDEPEGETEKQKRKRERQERRERKELKRSKKAVKEKRKKSKESESDEAGETETTTDTTAKESKKEKRKKKDRESKDSGDSDTEQKRSKKKRRKEATEATQVSVVIQKTTSITTTPAGSGTSTPTTRFTSRARFIAQKRAAFADPKALAQILMLKPPS